MIIRRKPGRTLYWGANLDPDDLPGSCDGHLVTFRCKLGDQAIVGQIGGSYPVKVGGVLILGPVTLTLTAVDEQGAHWDVRASRHIRILRDDAVRT